MIGGVDVADLGVADALGALAKAFVVSLDYRPSTVTAHADVVLPVAAHAEKTGTFVTWEGRPRPYLAALSTQALSDHRVLSLLAGELDAFLGTATVEEIRAEMTGLGAWSGPRLAAPTTRARAVPAPAKGEFVLASWHHLLDQGTLQDGEPFLAGTAPAAVARLSAASAHLIGLSDGDIVTVIGPGGAVSAPLVITPMIDRVVWLPANSRVRG